MSPWPRTTNGRRTRASGFGAFFTAGLAALLVACGVSLGSGNKSEFFRQLKVTGDTRTGGQLTLEVQYAQRYPVSLNVVCDLLDPNKPRPTATTAPTKLPSDVRASSPTPPQIPKPPATPVQRVLQILDETVAGNEPAPTAIDEKAPFRDVTPVVSTLTHQFQAPEQPGRYIVRCLTPVDDNNQIRRTIVIKGG